MGLELAMMGSLVGVGILVWWTRKRARRLVDVTTSAAGRLAAGPCAATHVGTAADRCAACRAAIVEEDSLFCPRCVSG